MCWEKSEKLKNSGLPGSHANLKLRGEHTIFMVGNITYISIRTETVKEIHTKCSSVDH